MKRATACCSESTLHTQRDAVSCHPWSPALPSQITAVTTSSPRARTTLGTATAGYCRFKSSPSPTRPVFSTDDACWPWISWREGIFIPNLSEDNETGLQGRHSHQTANPSVSSIWSPKEAGAKLSEVQLQQQFDRPDFVFPRIHHLDW